MASNILTKRSSGRAEESGLFPLKQSVNEAWNGRSKLKFPNGTTYKGDWLNGRMHGKGRTTYSNGTSYEGEHVNGFRHGRGKLTYSDGGVYEGLFVNDKAHGFGKLTCLETYEGQYVNGFKHGLGRLAYRSGVIYFGEFVNDLEHGRGKLFYPDGKKCEVEFVNGGFQSEGKVADPRTQFSEWQCPNELKNDISIKGKTLQHILKTNHYLIQGKLENKRVMLCLLFNILVDSNDDKIKKRYHEFQLLIHPDKNGNDQYYTEGTQIISRAYKAWS